MDDIKILAETLVGVTHPGMKTKHVIEAVREKHPEASKKSIVRAGFYALTETSPKEDGKTKHLHNFALAERSEKDEPKIVKLKKKAKNRERHAS